MKIQLIIYDLIDENYYVIILFLGEKDMLKPVKKIKNVKIFNIENKLILFKDQSIFTSCRLNLEIHGGCFHIAL